MKTTIVKTLLLLTLVLTLAGCSSDDNAPAIAQPVAETILGKWYAQGYKIKDQGYQTVVHLCAANRNYTEFTEAHMIQRGFNAQCEVTNDLNAEYVVGKSNSANDFYDMIDSDKMFRIITLNNKTLILRTDITGLDGFGTEIDFYYTRE